jgi:hypothetical protein
MTLLSTVSGGVAEALMSDTLVLGRDTIALDGPSCADADPKRRRMEIGQPESMGWCAMRARAVVAAVFASGCILYAGWESGVKNAP